MLRVILEVIPDNVAKDKRRGRIVRVIDIKEDGSGSYDYGNYKSRWGYSLEKMPGDEGWRKKQVLGMPYKEFRFERLLHQALGAYLKDLDEGTIMKNRYGDKSASTD
jgi:hypothetical protein